MTMCLIVKLLNHFSWDDLGLNNLWQLYLLFVEAIWHGPWVSLCDLAGMPRIQGPDHSSIVSFFRVAFAASNLKWWANVSPQLKSRLASPSYKSSEFLKLIVPLLLHNPLSVLDLCHPCRTWGTWETNANGHEALTTTFAVNNKVFATDPEVLCFIWHPWNNNKLIC